MDKKEATPDNMRKIIDYQMINLSAQQTTYPKMVDTNQGWIKYGADNNFPQMLIDLCNQSAINKAIIENKITYILGNGLDDSIDYGKPNEFDTWDNLIEKLARDYTTFGGFFFTVIPSVSGRKVSVYHKDFSRIRIGAVDKYYKPDCYLLASDWQKVSSVKDTVNIQALLTSDLTKLEIGVEYGFMYKDYEPSLPYYPIPSYYSALNYIEADGLLSSFYRNAINNGFTPSVIITIPGNMGEEEKEKFDKDLKASFCGNNGNNGVMVLYGESKDIKPEVVPFQASKNADTYNNVDDIIFQKIISAHRLSSPTLAGISGSGGLGGNANEIINSYVLYNQTVIKKLRRTILDALNPYLKFNNYPQLIIKEIDLKVEIEATQDTQVVNPNNTQVDENPIL